MAKIARRLVMTGHDPQGRSRIMSDRLVGGAPGPALRGSEVARLWGTDAPMRYPDEGAMPPCSGFFAPVHGARLVELYLPAHAEQYESFAGDEPGSSVSPLTGESGGMHRTATTDIIIVLEGRLDCELEAETVTLQTGDILIQNGTIHAWFNPYDKPCRFLAAMIGAEHALCPDGEQGS